MKLSIITINYNNAHHLARTIKSVIDQTWKNFEYIIIDGGSTDESIEIINQFQERISHWVSEPDNGVYHAMNKGIIKATGEYLLMLNAGDVLCDNNVLNRVFVENKYNEDIIYGDVFRESKSVIFTESIFPDKLTFLFLRDGALSHQAAFISSKLHSLIGLYDESLKLCSDWSFILLAICKYNASYKHLNYKISVCNADGLTCSPANAALIVKERRQILTTHFSAFLDDYEFFGRIINMRINRRLQRLNNRLILKYKSLLRFVSIGQYLN